MIVRPNNQAETTQDLDVMICWFNQMGLRLEKYTVIHCSNEVKVMIKSIHYRLDINTLHRDEEYQNLGMNDILKVSMRTTKPLLTDAYRKNRLTGSLILIDEATNETVAAGMIVG